MPRGSKWHIPISLALIASLITPLIAWGYISLFTRYWYDDFCYAAAVHRLGFVRSQIYWYSHWTGRYTFLFINTVLAYLGPKSASLLGVTLLVSWLVAAAWSIYQLFSLMRLRSPLASSFLLATLIVYSTLNSAPDIVGSFYWQCGALVYTLPLILLVLYCGLIIYVVRKKPNLGIGSPLVIAGAVLTFLAGGCSEISGLVQIAGLSLLALITFRYASGSTRRLLLLMTMSGLVGAVLSFPILAFAPGNDVRRAFFPPHPHLLDVIRSSVSYSLGFVERHTRHSRTTALLSLLAPLWLAFALHTGKPGGPDSAPKSAHNRSGALSLFVIVPVAVLILMIVSVAPGFNVFSEPPPGRALIMPKFILITATVFWVFLGSLTLLERLPAWSRGRRIVLALSSLAVLALCIVSPLASARHTFALGGKARNAASVWDNLDQEIRRSRDQGVRNLLVPAINANERELGWGRADLQPGMDPNSRINRCLAEYYGLDTIATK